LLRLRSPRIPFSPGTTMGGKGGGGFTLRTSIAAIVGGTASKIGGGKFSNGAVSGAFVHMFNAEGIAKKIVHRLNSNGSSNTSLRFFGGKKINIKAFTRSAKIESFYYTVKYHLIDSQGNLMPHLPSDWLLATKAVTVGFTNMMTTSHTYIADIPSFANPHVVYWTVAIPPQATTNANSSGYGLDVTQ